MNLQPTFAASYLEQRQVFSQELVWGGHGQIPLSGAGCYTPTAGYSFYQIDWHTAATVTSVSFRGDYAANAPDFVGKTFPAGSTWLGPITSVCISAGTGIAYQYRINPIDSGLCGSC